MIFHFFPLILEVGADNLVDNGLGEDLVNRMVAGVSPWPPSSVPKINLQSRYYSPLGRVNVSADDPMAFELHKGT